MSLKLFIECLLNMVTYPKLFLLVITTQIFLCILITFYILIIKFQHSQLKSQKII